MSRCPYEGADQGAHECPSCCSPHSKPGRRILASALVGALVVLAVGGAGGDASSLIGGLWDPDRSSITQDTKSHLGMTQRGALEVGGASASGSAILAFDTPVPAGGRDPTGLRREIAVAADGAIAIFTSGDLVAVDVRDHLATAPANSAALPSEVMMIAGQSGGTVRALATDATGGLAITDSGNDLTVSGSTDAPFTQGGGVITADTMRATLATDDLIVPDIDAVRVAVEIMDDWDELNRAAVNPIAGQVGVQGAAGVATALTQRTTIATDDVVTIDGSAGAAVQQGAGVVSAATLRVTQSTDDAAAVALADDSIALEAGTATVGSVQIINGTGGLAVNVQDGGNSLTIDSAQLPAALVGGRLDVVVGAALPAGANNIGDVDVLTLPALIAGTATVGSVTMLARDLLGASVAPLAESDRALRTASSLEVHIDNLGARQVVATAIVVSATLAANAATQIVAAQGAGVSIVVLDWIVSVDAATNVRFLSGDSDPDLAISPGVSLTANAGWTSDHPAQWFETGDNLSLRLWSSGAATVGVMVRYVTR